LYGTFRTKNADQFSDIDLIVNSEDTLDFYKYISAEFEKQKNYLLGYTLPFIEDKIVYASLWKIDDKPFLVELTINSKNKGLLKLEIPKFSHFTGLVWHSFVAYKRSDLVELANQMSLIRELYLFDLVKKSYGIKTLKHTNKTLDKKTYNHLLGTYSSFSDKYEVRRSLIKLIKITASYFPQKSNFVLDYVLKGLRQDARG
jgi:hypothetical protein